MTLNLIESIFLELVVVLLIIVKVEADRVCILVSQLLRKASKQGCDVVAIRELESKSVDETRRKQLITYSIV